MTFEYWPQEIALALIEIGNINTSTQEGRNIYAETIDALYYLKAICENEHNNDMFRTFYKLLEQVTENHNRE